MKLQPVDERVVIRPLEEKEKKVGSIIIPDTVKERPQIGEVVTLGDDVPKKEGGKPLSQILKVGDKVVYSRYGGTEVKLDNEEFLIVSRGDILAVVKD